MIINICIAVIVNYHLQFSHFIDEENEGSKLPLITVFGLFHK